jgi:2-C-methyl-D-erythritol 4-phosphate cytidylyltransferase / 2-C-methyl-D-erythritol 2,4-cyclodiphosphate synthase
MKLAAIITAAGSGLRASGLHKLTKQWVQIAGKPVVAHALDAFEGMVRVLTINPEHQALARDLPTDVQIVFGGATRAASVRNALMALQDQGITHVLIHDGARPVVSGAVIDRVVAALAGSDGAAPALAVTDALWTGADGRVTGSRDRSGLYRAQTPQGFHYDAILQAHARARGTEADDVEVALAAGMSVAIVEGDERNVKLTVPADFDRIAALLKERADGY